MPQTLGIGCSGQRAQLQLAPQLQTSPQRQSARRSDGFDWHPHVQAAPMQVSQVQVLVVAALFDMTELLCKWLT
jgi:hypothetical protein